MNSCEYYQELISRLVDGEIGREEHEDLMAHMKSCSRCNAMFAIFHDLSDLLSEEPEELPSGLHETIMASVRRSAIEKKNRRLRRAAVSLAMTAAACFVLAFFAATGFGPGRALQDTVSVRSEEAAQQLLPAATPEPAAMGAAETLPEPDVQMSAAAPAPVWTPAPASTSAPVRTAAPTPDVYLQPAITNAPVQPEVYFETIQTPAPAVTAPENTVSYALPDIAALPELPEPVEAPPVQNAVPNEAPVSNGAGAALYRAPGDALPELAALMDDLAAAEDAVLEEAAEEPPAPAEEYAANAASVEEPAEMPMLASNQVRLFAAPAEESEDAALPMDTAETEEAPAALSEEPEPAKVVPVREYSLRGDEARIRLLLTLGGNQALLPELDPSYRIWVTLFPDDSYGSAEKLEITVYGDFIFYTYYPLSGETASFRADCSVEALKNCLNAIPAPVETPEPTVDPFSDEAPIPDEAPISDDAPTE